MFLLPKASLKLSLHSLRRFKGFSNSRGFRSTQCAYLRQVSSRHKKTVEVQDSESSSSVAGKYSASVPLKNVNDNFFGIESDEGVIEIESKPSLNNDTARQEFINVEQEKFVSTIFGTVRYDSENKPKSHGQLEKEDVLISSLNYDKIHSLNRALNKKNSLDSHSVSSNTENSKAVSDISDRNLKSKSLSNSYVDELYFPESYAEKEDNAISKLESSSSSSNKDKLNYIEESYFGDKVTGDSIFKNNTASESIDDSDKNHPILQAKPAEYIADDKQSNYFDDYYFNTISDSNHEVTGNENLEHVSKTVDTVKKQSFKKNITISPGVEKNEVSEKLFLNKLEVGIVDSEVTRDTKFNPQNLFNAQETKANMKISKLNERIEKNDAFDDGEQFSLKLNNPNLEELEFNKFIPNAINFPKTKNNFSLKNKEFLKKIKSTNSNSSYRMEKLKSLRRNVDESNAAEETENKEEVIETTQMHQSKVQKEANDKNSDNNELPETAHDFVKKLRSTKQKFDPGLINGKFVQKTERYDSKGFRILKYQVPDFKHYTRDEILGFLVKNVLYSDDDLIVLNKPYNLVMHESKTTKDPCLSQYLDDLAAELDKTTYKPKLITVHRLDKETAGCLLLARNEKAAQKMLSYFSQRKIVKKYWIVTTKVPDPLEGVIDMPIAEGSVNGKSRMVLHPDLPKDISYQSHSRSGKRAVTHYQVIAESGNAALVEVKPETGIKHQIRVHFGFGLSCPILGDHKYSHFDKMAPQKLQADLLQRLHVRQSKVRHIPMHIYARSIFIPQYQDGKNLFVMAPMPIHMSQNLQKLKFKKN